MLSGTKSRAKLNKSLVTKKLFYRKLLYTPILNFTFTLCVCLCMCVNVCMCESACMEVRGRCVEMVLSFHPVDSIDKISGCQA